MPAYTSKTQGFTLIELITVIVILSILAVMGTQFIISSTQNYESTRTRALLVNTSRQAVEQITRQLRIALPYSVVTSNGGQCIKFMPIAAGGVYLTPVPDSANGAAANASIEVSPHSIEFGEAKYVSIGAMSAADIYASTPSSIAPLAARTQEELTLAEAKRWNKNSIARRFYLLDSPQAICVVANQLRFYAEQTMNSTAVDLTKTSSLMSDHVAATGGEPVFSLASSSENRNAVVTINLAFSNGGETVEFTQEVMIRNVP